MDLVFAVSQQSSSISFNFISVLVVLLICILIVMVNFLPTFLKNIILLGTTPFWRNDVSNTLHKRILIDTEPPDLIPRQIFFEYANRSNAQLSPDGLTVSFVAPLNGTKNVWVIRTDELLNVKNRSKILELARPITFDTDRGIWSYSWTDMKNILLYSQDNDGDENYKLYKVNAESGETTVLSESAGVKTRVMASSEMYPDLLIIGLNNRSSAYHDLYKLNISTGAKELVLINDQFGSFVFDNDLKLRLASKIDNDASTLYYQPVTVNETITDWKLYRNISLDDSYSVSLMGFDKSNTKLYWNNAFDGDLTGIELANFTDYLNDVHTIYVPQKSDVSSTLFHPIDQTLLVVYENYMKPTYTIMNETIRDDFRLLQNIDPSGKFGIASSSKDFNQWLIYSYSDVKPTRYYFYDRKKKYVQFLFPVKDVLEGFVGAPMHPVEIAVSGGFTQVCYLTLPKESDPLKSGHPVQPVPLILKVHGGPWSRSRWGFSSSTQYWANRGYGILDCNFRVSTGYGKKWFNAGRGQWSKDMHQDLIDAVDWAIERGIADPKRIAIYGASYGGYAALVGLTFTPTKFACGIDLFGPSNVETLLDSVPDYWKPNQARQHAFIGADPKTEEGKRFLYEISPIHKADRIVRPLLIAQGLNDVRVVKNESDQMVQAVKDNQIPVTYIVFPNEGHGFARQENRLAFHALNEQFLQICLKGRAEPIKNEMAGSSVILEEDGFELLKRKQNDRIK